MMDLYDIQQMNKRRAELWHEGAKAWSGADWSNAMCGEAGEAANIVKKLRRIETKITNVERHNKGATAESLKSDLGEELADTFLYLLLLASHYSIDFERHLEQKFNRTSRENGFPQMLQIVKM